MVESTQERSPSLGTTRLVLIDGPAGSGKTTLADRLAEVLRAQVVHGDDIYEGWSGLHTMWPVLGGQILEPLARGTDASFRRWDWVRDERAESIHIPKAEFLVIEGVGVAQRAARRFASLVVFVEAPAEVRLKRGVERDGNAMRADWVAWQRSEQELFAREGTRGAADVVVDGTAPVPDAYDSFGRTAPI
jgi:uridine kinase